MSPAFRRALAGVVSIGGLLALWHVSATAGWVSPLTLPSPASVLSAMQRIATGYMGAGIGRHLTASLSVVMSGFLAALAVGVPLGVGMAHLPVLDRLFGPLLAVLRPIPPPAWIPLAILWFGIGLSGKTFIVFVSAVVPVLVNAQAAAAATPPKLVQAARTLGAGERTILLEIILPSALPVILTGARIALGNAWATLVAAELVVASAGLGFLVMNGYRNFESNVMAAAMIVIALLGAAMNLGFAVLERLLVRWPAPGGRS